MDEDTIAAACLDCGTTITRRASGRGKPKLYCEDCAATRRRGNTRRCHQRKRTQVRPASRELFCRGCNVSLGMSGCGKQREVCDECREAGAREYQRQLRVANSRPERVFHCEMCGGQIERRGRSGLPRFCMTCTPVARRVVGRRSDARRQERRTWLRRNSPGQFATQCDRCASHLKRPRRRSGRLALCYQCSRVDINARLRAAAPSRANTTCVDCQIPIPQKRKGPVVLRCATCAVPQLRLRWKVYGQKHSHIRRARKLSRPVEKFGASEIFERDGWRCGICGAKIPRSLAHPHPMSVSLDHKVPLSKGGAHTRSNCQAAHLRCNLRKRDAVAPLGGQIPLF
jgi:DNA-directed RNA polymerase subunit M/transcription elongation factor TFIIS